MKSIPPLRAVAWIALGTLLGAAGCGRGEPAALSSQDQSTLAAYEQIRQALANDDFVEARAGAKALASVAKAPGIQTEAQTIIDAAALDRQRQALRSLSEDLAPLVKGRPGFYILSSPIDPQTIWIQRSPDADNPYMGKVMHDSGAVVH